MFTSVGLRISPVKVIDLLYELYSAGSIFFYKGSAIFWWNLKKSGEGDYLTKHAGCPVLVGSKWGM